MVTKKIHSYFDTTLGVNVDLFTMSLSSLRELAKSWYGDINFADFDERKPRTDGADNSKLSLMKTSGLINNFFFAYEEDNKKYLLDGFNRLFTEYGEVEDQVVFLKLIRDKLSDSGLMRIMFLLNMWKLNNSGHYYGGFSIRDFLDRGFRLLLYSKFNISLYSYKNIDYHNRTRDNHDIDVLDKYFVGESEDTGDFKWGYAGTNKLLSNVNVINDFKELIKANDYLTKQFNNYHLFLDGYAMFISELRVKSDDRTFTFNDALELLYADKTFYKKLIGMSGNDSTRKNIYKFFRKIK